MGPCRAVSPLLLLLALAGATTPGTVDNSTLGTDGSTPGVAGSVSPSPWGRWAVSYEDVVAAAVELLNAKAIVVPSVLRLQQLHPRPGWAEDLRQRQELSFTVEETCRSPGTVTTACKSCWFGTLRWCRGWVFLEQQQPVVELFCHWVTPTLGQNRPSPLRDLVTRISDRLRNIFLCRNIWIRDKLNLQPPKP
ncbi:cathelicidin-B1 precursor [Patagioenas fasciata monilis]|uniref:Cathelicidin-B1 n=1 Tax=Patagioenas fasciata monilis TaxID=372326 RepID=A0A1V4J704_PATFA|nr:cathelicidin-B1 precursor [Patagioenas fasciata monilis]